MGKSICTSILKYFSINYRNPNAHLGNSFFTLSPDDWRRNWPEYWPEYESKNQSYVILGE